MHAKPRPGINLVHETRLVQSVGRVTLTLVATACFVWASCDRSYGQSEPQEEARWTLAEVPSTWKTLTGGHYGRREGYRWFRCVVSIPAEWEGTRAELFVEAVDDAREIYFNGNLVGTLGTMPPEYRSGLGISTRFEIDHSLIVHGGDNVIAVRIYQNESRGGFNVAAPVIFSEHQAIRLAGPWEMRQGDDTDWAKLSSRSEIHRDAVFANTEDAQAVAKTLRRLSEDDRPLDLTAAARRMKTPADVVVELAVGEPHVCQPLSMKWDERGRLWVVQYLQYPDPAGLRMVSRDKYLRTVYDKIPPPPPNHFRGRDKITIHEDSDGDGRYDRHKTFVEGLNMVTAMARGRGGVWVLNPPYLLFYADLDADDKPDGPPDVHLEGFGLEDSHSLVNSLCWGPDGWLYAAQGSTVTGRVKQYGSDAPPRSSMGQLIWRYHPASRRYEIFAEGGGNAFGVEIDSKGRIYSGHNGGDTRGFHYVQGGYFQKGFGKHGQLSNPYAFGYLPWMEHHRVPRFTHTFIIYESTHLPDAYHGKLFGVAPLQGHVVQSDVSPDGSTFKTHDEGYLLESSDPWFRPVDIQLGPDGAIYVADFYEQRIDHASHYQGRIHRESGRIYRIRSLDTQPITNVNLSEQTTAQLIDVLDHKNRWYRQTALRLLWDRQDASVAGQLRSRLDQSSGQSALETLWALNATGGLSDADALRALTHDDPHVRLWTIRLVCDRQHVSADLAERLVDLARDEPHIEVRSQLACSARRLSAHQGLPIVAQLLQRAQDVDDVHLPLLLWWAIEFHASRDHAAVLRLLERESIWDAPIVMQHILSRLMRRYAMDERRDALKICARLLRMAPSNLHARQLLTGFEEAFQGRSLAEIPDELADAIADAGGGSLALQIRRRDETAIGRAIEIIHSDQHDEAERIELIRILGELQLTEAVPHLLRHVIHTKATPQRVAALSALQSFTSPKIGQEVIGHFPAFPSPVRDAALGMLVSRATWSLQLVSAVADGRIDKESIPDSAVRQMLLHDDGGLRQQVSSIWGTVDGATSDDMLREIQRLDQLLRKGSGVPHQGKPLFADRCGKCHKLFQEGNDIGPDLTSYDRTDLRRLLVNVVNPSLETREGYENHVMIMVDGRVLSGLIVDQDNQVVVLKTSEGQKHIARRDEIEELIKDRRSLMPEDTLTELNDQQVRDLFAYLRSTQPLP